MKDIDYIMSDFHYSIQHYLMMKNSDAYVSITVYLFQDVNINLQWIHRQHFMLSHPVFNEISIDAYKKGISPTIM